MDYEAIVKEQMNHVLEGEDFGTVTDEAYRLSEGLSDPFTLENILNSTLQGESIFNGRQMIDTFSDLMLYEFQNALTAAAEIISICIIMGLMKSLAESFKTKGAAQLTVMVCVMVIMGISLNSFKLSFQLVMDTVSAMVYTMEILLPVLIGILLATGAAASGTILSPLIIGAAAGFAVIMKNLILPALFLSGALSMINCLTEKDYVNKLAKLLRSSAVFLTGLILTVLTGIITLQGLLTETADGILISTAKYSISSFIPIVGGFASDTVELFLRCMGSIKSVIGVFGILTLILMMAVPLLKVVLIGAVYKLTSALSEPVTDSKIADGINDMGSCMIAMASILFFTSLLFIIFISVIMGIGGAS